MPRFSLRAAALAFLAAQSAMATAGELSDSTVEKILGLGGIKHTAKVQANYGYSFADLEYKDAEGNMVFVLRLAKADQFMMWKVNAGAELEPVSGIGSEAFRYKALKGVCAKAANAAVCATSSFSPKKRPVTDAQLQALAKAALDG